MERAASGPDGKYLGVKAWYFRDANWSPDFPDQRQDLMDFYVRERAMGGTPVAEPPTVLIAFQPDVFEGALTLTGPITVRGKTFDRRNVFDLLQYEVEVGFAAEGIRSATAKAWWRIWARPWSSVSPRCRRRGGRRPWIS